MPATGHINIVQPVAHELVKRKHVTWLTGTLFQASVEKSGATFIQFTSKCTEVLENLLFTDQSRHGTGFGAAIATLVEIFVTPISPFITQYGGIFQNFNADIILVDLCSLPASVLHERGGPRYATLSVIPFHSQSPEMPPWGSSNHPEMTYFGQLLNILQHWIAN